MAVLFLLLPVQCLVLPLNTAIIDWFSTLCFPLCWVWLAHVRWAPRFPYLLAMLGILLASAVASVASRDPMVSIPVLAKEVYLYVFLLTIAGVLERLDARALRRLLVVWYVVVCAHGALILVQFVDPPLLAAMNSGLAGVGSLDPFRPSGLMENSNAAALFQVSAFVPLFTLRLPRPRSLLLGSLLLATTLATGSLGATLAFACGLGAVLVGLLVLARGSRPVLGFVLTAMVGAALLALLLLALSQSYPHLQERINYVLSGRSSYSAASRFGIWSRGTQVLLSELSPWGIGPDLFKVIDGHELHNDLLSFVVERGLLAALALLLFGGMAFVRAAQVAYRFGAHGAFFALVFPAAMVGMLMEAQTHEIFHQRAVWLILALQEAIWRRSAGMRAPVRRSAPSTDRPGLAPAIGRV